MLMLQVDGLHKKYTVEKGEVRAVRGVGFQVEEGQFYTLLGPSGCGKTTTLRCVAGLERPEAGDILIEGKVLSSTGKRQFVPPHKRDIGMVFQSYAIWPHMTVFENVAFPLRALKLCKSERELRERVRAALATVQLDHLESRPAPLLSGGQQQRLALARALVRQPKVLLLDEPLSNLDAKLREEMRVELRELQRRLGITTIYVTHDQGEALAMSNVVAVMNDGVIVQEGPPREIYEHPRSRFVAEFVGANLIPARLAERASPGALGRLVSSIGDINLSDTAGAQEQQEVVVSIRPENVLMHLQQPDSRPNVYGGTVQVAVYLGDYLECQVLLNDVVVQSRQHPSLRVRGGDNVFLELPPESCVLVADVTGSLAV